MRQRDFFQPHPDIQYAVETTTIKLINTRTGEVHTLGYPQAAIWDMASRACDEAAIVDVLGVVLRVTTSHAQIILSDTLDAWHKRGFLIREEDK